MLQIKKCNSCILKAKKNCFSLSIIRVGLYKMENLLIQCLRLFSFYFNYFIVVKSTVKLIVSELDQSLNYNGKETETINALFDFMNLHNGSRLSKQLIVSNKKNAFEIF